MKKQDTDQYTQFYLNHSPKPHTYISAEQMSERVHSTVVALEMGVGMGQELKIMSVHMFLSVKHATFVM